MNDILKQFDEKLLSRETEFIVQFIERMQSLQREVLALMWEATDGDLDDETVVFLIAEIKSRLEKEKQDMGLVILSFGKDIQEMAFENHLTLFQDFFKMTLDAATILALSLPQGDPAQSQLITSNFLSKFFNALGDQFELQLLTANMNDRGVRDIKPALVDFSDKQEHTIKKFGMFLGQLIYNATTLALLKIANTIRPMKKQWVSVLDARTTPVCNALDGQVQPLDEPFIDPDSGSKFMFPPAVYGNPGLKPIFHHCRSMVIPYVD